MEPNNNAPVQGPVLAPLLEAPIWRDFAVLTYSNHVRHVAPGVSSFHLVAEARVGFLRKFWNRTCPACGWLFHLGVWTLGLIVSHLLVARTPTRRDSRSSTKTKQHVGKPNENVVLGGWNHDGHEMKWNFSKVLNQICRYVGLNPNRFPEFFLGEILDYFILTITWQLWIFLLNKMAFRQLRLFEILSQTTRSKDGRQT